jgi:hypothetical protein
VRCASSVWCRIATSGLAGLVLLGCSPTFDWRVVPLDGRWTATFPCKPERRERAVTIGAGNPVRMAQWACEAGGATYVLAHATAAGVAEAEAAAPAWLQMTASNAEADVERREAATLGVAAGGGTATRALLVARPGAAQRLRMDVLTFTRASDVFQVAVVAPSAAPAREVETFFDGLTLLRR